MSKSYLTTPLEDYRVLHYDGLPATACHAQLKEVMRTNGRRFEAAGIRDPENFFAEPVTDGLSSMDWYVVTDRDPVLLKDVLARPDLDPRQRAYLSSLPGRCLAALDQYARGLEDGPGQDRLRGILELIVANARPEDWLLIPPDRLVLTRWGLQREGTNIASPRDIVRLPAVTSAAALGLAAVPGTAAGADHTLVTGSADRAFASGAPGGADRAFASGAGGADRAFMSGGPAGSDRAFMSGAPNGPDKAFMSGGPDRAFAGGQQTDPSRARMSGGGAPAQGAGGPPSSGGGSLFPGCLTWLLPLGLLGLLLWLLLAGLDRAPSPLPDSLFHEPFPACEAEAGRSEKLDKDTHDLLDELSRRAALCPGGPRVDPRDPRLLPGGGHGVPGIPERSDGAGGSGGQAGPMGPNGPGGPNDSTGPGGSTGPAGPMEPTGPVGPGGNGAPDSNSAPGLLPGTPAAPGTDPGPEPETAPGSGLPGQDEGSRGEGAPGGGAPFGEPDFSTPDFSGPGAMGPGSLGPGSLEPDASGPGAQGPGALEPDFSGPGGAPDFSGPGSATGPDAAPGEGQDERPYGSAQGPLGGAVGGQDERPFGNAQGPLGGTGGGPDERPFGDAQGPLGGAGGGADLPPAGGLPDFSGPAAPFGPDGSGGSGLPVGPNGPGTPKDGGTPGAPLLGGKGQAPFGDALPDFGNPDFSPEDVPGRGTGPGAEGPLLAQGPEGDAGSAGGGGFPADRNTKPGEPGLPDFGTPPLNPQGGDVPMTTPPAGSAKPFDFGAAPGGGSPATAPGGAGGEAGDGAPPAGGGKSPLPDFSAPPPPPPSQAAKNPARGRGEGANAQRPQPGPGNDNARTPAGRGSQAANDPGSADPESSRANPRAGSSSSSSDMPDELKRPGQPLSIPEDAARTGDLGFLGGCWKSADPLTREGTNRALEVIYCFDRKGNGRRCNNEPDQQCRGPVKARFVGRTLVLSASRSSCPTGTGYAPQTVECNRTADGRTFCRGRDRRPDGTTNLWDAHFVYTEEVNCPRTPRR